MIHECGYATLHKLHTIHQFLWSTSLQGAGRMCACHVYIHTTKQYLLSAHYTTPSAFCPQNLILRIAPFSFLPTVSRHSSRPQSAAIQARIKRS